ncbi:MULTISPECIES: hypothetical protein [Methylobacterium]|uniref:hypothetical protein n=1 Tax=Methylobacterium TaxID=407 RepID=UPI001FF01FDE|nr:hypothetical protein [Methylobacterium sp. DB0501]
MSRAMQGPQAHKVREAMRELLALLGQQGRLAPPVLKVARELLDQPDRPARRG